MKKITIVLMVTVAISLLVAGCASTKANSFMGPGNYYGSGTVSVAKTGEASSTVVLGIFGKENFPSAERVAKENGISKIATVEHYAKPGILFLWSTYTTVVSGE